MRCGRCCKVLRPYAGETTGDSGIYLSHGIDLCEPCCDAEDQEIDEAGTNDLPDTLKRYRENLRKA